MTHRELAWAVPVTAAAVALMFLTGADSLLVAERRPTTTAPKPRPLSPLPDLCAVEADGFRAEPGTRTRDRNVSECRFTGERDRAKATVKAYRPADDGSHVSFDFSRPVQVAEEEFAEEAGRLPGTPADVPELDPTAREGVLAPKVHIVLRRGPLILRVEYESSLTSTGAAARRLAAAALDVLPPDGN